MGTKQNRELQRSQAGQESWASQRTMEYARNMAKEGPLGVLRPDTDVYMCSINYLACNCSL